MAMFWPKLHVNRLQKLDIVGTVYHLVIYMQSNKIHKVIFND